MNEQPAREPAPDSDRLADLLGVALDLPAGERREFLQGACDGEPELLAEVLSLVEAGEAAARVRLWSASPVEGGATLAENLLHGDRSLPGNVGTGSNLPPGIP